MNEFRKNQRVYNIRGEVGLYVCSDGKSHIVCPISDGYDDNGYTIQIECPPEFWRDVFEKPPVRKLDEDVRKKNEELISKSAELSKIEKEINLKKRELDNIEKDSRERLNKLKNIEALKYLEDFIDGKITHYVKFSGYNWATIENCGFEIVEHNKEILSSKEDWNKNRNFKLISLFGKSNGDLQWNINRYSDGSGNYTAIIPFKSYEDALEYCKNLWSKEIIKLNTEGKISHNIYVSAMKYNLEIPKNVVEYFLNKEAEIKLKQMNELQTNVGKIKDEISEINRKLSSL